MMIGRLKLCRMRLPYRQRQLERFLAAPRPQIGNAHGSHNVSAMIRPPEARKTPITRERLCWDDHEGKSEREGTFQREYLLTSTAAVSEYSVFGVPVSSKAGRRIILSRAGLPFPNLYLNC